MASINDILDKVRSGEIKGKVEFNIDKDGKINKIIVQPQNDYKEIVDSINKIQASEEDIKKADFSRTNISGNLSGLDLSGSRFSYSRIEHADMSNTNLEGASFEKAVVTQTDMKNAYSVDMRGAYLTGSVDLYGVQDSPDISGLYKNEPEQSSGPRWDANRAFVNMQSEQRDAYHRRS